MKNILISFLGTRDYQEARYKLDDSLVSDRNKYFQVALCQLLKQKGYNIDKVIIFITSKVSKNYNNLEVELRNIFEGQIEAVDIPDGQTENQMWEIFNRIGAKLKTETQGDEDVRLIIDITHGFRALPVTLILALLFYKNIYGFNIESVYYGAFEAREVRDGEEIAPIFDLTPMIGLAEWSESLIEWKRTGRGDILYRKMFDFKKHMKGVLKAPLPFEEIIDSFRLFNASLDLLNVNEIFDLAIETDEDLKKFKNNLGNIISTYPIVSPMNEILTYIQKDLLPVVNIEETTNFDKKAICKSKEEEISNFITKETLINMVNLADWYIKRDRIIETYTVLRETLSIFAAYIITKKIDLGEVKLNMERKSFWDDCFAIVRSVCYQERYPDPGSVFEGKEEIKRVIMTKLVEWFDKRSEIKEFFRIWEDKIGKKRNSIDHCFVGSFERLSTQQPLEEYINDAKESIEAIKRLINMVE